ncbi:MerR family transcriptional regulator [Clostridium intestinale]|uniref:MerR family transcriptional regulator n=1 Tax=Clostridium intestinale TaxID=36845 RepID=UPI002DD65A20|nr:MerR family transcriptional regulator [Clostridium intestinale]WRY51267.1 MerR family transcriptional regulator [Clostridium intestinale]
MEKEGLKIGELAKRTGMTVRALHHYHHIGLLTPSEFTDSNHRIYTKEDILKLQQIIFLKELGLRLEDVKDIIERPNYNPAGVIKYQLDKVKEKIKIEQELCEELEILYKFLKGNKDVDLEKFIEVIQLMQVGVYNHFTEEQIEKMKNIRRSFTDEEQEKMQKEWTDFINRLQRCYDNNTQFEDEEVKKLVNIWTEAVDKITNKDKEIVKAAENFHGENPDNPISFGMTGELYRYLQEAIEKNKIY